MVEQRVAPSAVAAVSAIGEEVVGIGAKSPAYLADGWAEEVWMGLAQTGQLLPPSLC